MGKRLALWIGSMLTTYGGEIVARVLLALGFGFVTYKFSVGPLRNLLLEQLGTLPSEALQIIGFLGIDKAMTMILSAIVAKYGVSGVKRLVKL